MRSVGANDMRLRLWTVLLGVFGMLLSGAAPAAAQQAPGSGAWQPGPAASGDGTSLAGVIDTPTSGASMPPGNLQLSGWFIDLSAQGWAGADDVEIFAGSMDGGGRPLGHAQLAQSRPDVAAALNNPFWVQSGWSANISTSSLPVGATTLSVYVHTPGRGWWLRQVSITLRPPPQPTRGQAPATQPAPPPPSVYGNDIAYPQCPTGAEPASPAFAIVGVNAGRPFSGNPCLARQFVWALTSTSANQPRLAFYLNTANPGPTASNNWPSAATSAPRACDGSWSADCAYDYGWLAAQDAYNRALGVAGNAAQQVPWWLDVEAVNSWSDDRALNAADLSGVIAFLRSQAIGALGVYSTSTDWEALIGATPGLFDGLPNWRPGATNPQDVQDWCSRTVTGGRVKLVQFPNNGFDADFACY